MVSNVWSLIHYELAVIDCLLMLVGTAELVRSFSGPLRLRMKASDALASRFALLKAGNSLEDRSSGEHLIRARLPSGA